MPLIPDVKSFGAEAILLRLNMQGVALTEKNTTFYLYCDACDFQQDVAMILPRTPFETVDALRKEVHRFHCSVCGAKHIVIKEEPVAVSQSGFVF